MDMHLYMKPYPEKVDRLVPLPRGYKIPNFATFFEEDEKSTIEHIGRLTMQCDEENNYEFYKLQLFPLLLTGTTLT